MVVPYVSRRSREEASRLLTLLTSATQRLIKPYALPMLRVLLPKANDANPVVAGQVLMCLGELSSVGGEEFAPHIPQIMSVILSTLGDPAALSKREAALLTLGQLCTNTSYVITPIIEHSQLMPLLGRVLKSEPSANIRRQTIRVLGILGAIDPYRRKVVQNPYT
jgi:serine/threonine-protein kinase mTOR